MIQRMLPPQRSTGILDGIKVLELGESVGERFGKTRRDGRVGWPISHREDVHVEGGRGG